MSNNKGPFMQVMEKYTKSLKAFISAQGFGHYSKPSGGIPKTDLEQSVQNSLGKADTALQSFSESDPTVPSWAKASTKPSYTQDEVGDGTTYKRVSATEKTTWNNKGTYSKPSGGIPKTDLASAVQISLGKADSALQSETDPTVPSWAKASSKPSYTASEVGAVPNTSAGVSAAINLLTTGDSAPTDNDYYVSQYAGGGSSTTTYHRRPVSKLWEYIRSKISLSTTGSGNAVTGVSYSNGAFTVTKGSSFAASSHTHDLSMALNNNASPSINLGANSIYTLTAGGKTYNFKTPSDNNTYPSAYCSTAASTAAKAATCTGYALLSNSYLHVIIATANTSASALTLNVNGKGAKPIYINGSASSASNYTLPAGSYLVYYDGTNYYFRTDGKVTTNGIIDISGNIGKVKVTGSKGRAVCKTRVIRVGSWIPVTLEGSPSNPSGNMVWNDGSFLYYSNGSDQYKINIDTGVWQIKTWTGLTSFSGDYIWTDGDNIYYSNGTDQYVLDVETGKWSTKSWSGLTSFIGYHIWTDGDNIYYSNEANQYVLNKATSTWSAKSWSGLTSFIGYHIWTDGDNIYYSNGSANEYVLNKATSTWSAKTWTGLTSFMGNYIWTDGDNIYYSYGTYQYVLDKPTSTWSVVSFRYPSSLYGNCIWSDGDNIYYTRSGAKYILAQP